MGASYTHDTQPTGATVTERLYNRAHQNHITNGGAATAEGHAQDVATMQAATDPGELGTETLGGYISDDLEQLRFILAEMKDTPYWYTSTYTKTEHIHCFSVIRGAPTVIRPELREGFSDFVGGLWVIPYAYASGNITFTCFIRGASGDVHYLYQFFLSTARAGGLLSGGANIVTHSNTNEVAVAFTVLEADVPAVGTPVFWVLTRDGASVSDTHAGSVYFQTAQVAYTAYAGVKD